MKMKKVLSLLLVGAMALTSVACGGSSSDEGSDKLVIWTLAEDLGTFADKYAEETGVEVEVVVVPPADYPTKVQAATNGGVDIIVAEPQMLGNMYDMGYFEDLNQAPYNAQDYADQIVDYVWEVGQDDDGIQRAISYQITPAGFFYRRDIAEKVFGTDEPEAVSEIFASYDTILEAGYTLHEAGYRIFASDGETSCFSGDSAWVIDGKLNVDQARYDYMDLCIELYQSDLTAYASQWSAPWYQSMDGEVPILTADTQWGTDDMNIWDEESFDAATEGYDTTEVFAFGLPSWGTLTLRDNVENTAGLWGVAQGPAYGFAGGTYVGICTTSKNKELAWDFLQYTTLNEEVSEWWVDVSEGDTVSLISTLEKFADVENETYGNQKLYSFWLEQAVGIDYSKVTKYDTIIADAWGAAIESIKTGQSTREDAINNFYDIVASTYPEIEITRD